MNSFTLHIWDDESRKCCFYTVTKEGALNNETDKFLEKYEQDPKFKTSLQELLNFVLNAIGEDHGAIDEVLNRYENEVIGLPPKGNVKLIKEIYHFPEFPLRLYALRITERILILFNGGVKDGAKNQTSSLHSNWLEACQFAKKIEEAINDGRIIVNSTSSRLTDENEDPEIFLY